MAFRLAGVPFEDIRIPLSEWPQRKAAFPFGTVPVLEVDGRQLSNSNTILHYVGKAVGMQCGDAFQMAKADEFMNLVEEFVTAVFQALFRAPPAEKAQLVEELQKGAVPRYLGWIEKTLAENGGTFSVGPELSVADLKLYPAMQAVLAGKAFPAPSLDPYPTLAAVFKRIQQEVDSKLNK
uniref:GST N-terminal domain-containing protein n=1 Tax=Arcella intermedia TaxID=1963864 RepID=A0A6B2LJZ0_9EUKA